MAKFSGIVAFAFEEETSPSVWEPVFEEKKFKGDVIKNIRRWSPGDSINGEVTTSTQISIVATPFAIKHFHDIRYVVWNKVKWSVPNVEPLDRRLLLTLGGEYKDE